jgi:hypothetical protein
MGESLHLPANPVSPRCVIALSSRVPTESPPKTRLSPASCVCSCLTVRPELAHPKEDRGCIVVLCRFRVPLGPTRQPRTDTSVGVERSRLGADDAITSRRRLPFRQLMYRQVTARNRGFYVRIIPSGEFETS